jgi:hypothetical protein
MDDNPYRAEKVEGAESTDPNRRPAGTTLLGIVAVVGGIVFLCSLGWLIWVFMQTGIFGRTIPPRGFTWDRFGPPMASLLIGLVVGVAAALGCAVRLDQRSNDF